MALTRRRRTDFLLKRPAVLFRAPQIKHNQAVNSDGFIVAHIMHIFSLKAWKSPFRLFVHDTFTIYGVASFYLSYGGNMHLNMVPIQIEDANLEIMARIVKAASRKYNCDVEIDFRNGARKVVFKGDEEMKGYIAGEVMDIFESREGDACNL
jgi:hypothetical protein